jgi:membrane-bound lytic murein transglycosylase D
MSTEAGEGNPLMSRRRVPLVLTLMGFIGLMACAANPPVRENAQKRARKQVGLGEYLTGERTLAEAESLYAVGSGQQEGEDWVAAEESYSAALQALAELTSAESYPSQATRYDQLVQNLAREYPTVLSHLDQLPQEGSLALLLMKLGELRADGVLMESQDSTASLELETGVPYDVPIDWNEKVEDSIRYFQVENRQAFARWLNRSGSYLALMQDILEQYGLPKDLIYLALIESGFNAQAYSWAHASGPWQFISSTGKRYGLTYDWWLDERRDPVKSTHAAAKYLQSLYDEFGDWRLALAAYNCGEVRVRQAIVSAGSRDFWKLRLPRQTMNYVPLFMAATIIAKSPDRYGFTVEHEPPLRYDEVTIDACTDLNVVARCCGRTVEEIRDLNPELRRWCTPPNEKAYRLKIPCGTQETFQANYALVPESEKVSWQRHKIQRGETLSKIARRYGTSVRAITEANSLRSSHRIIAGKYLLIPIGPYSRSSASSMSASARAADSGEKLIYTVKKGDVLSRIAASFGVGLSQLRRWNNLRSGAYIYPGDKLTVYLAPGGSASVPVAENYSELIYTVKRGDTLWDIAQDFGISLAELIRDNDLRDPSRIRPGSKLKIKRLN